MTPRTLKWLLFAAFTLTVPLLFFLLLTAGFFPLVGIAAITFERPRFVQIVFGLLHLAFYGFIFYWVAAGISLLCAKFSPRSRFQLAIGAIVGLFLVTLQPWYGWGGYATSKYVSLYELLRETISP